MKKKPVHNSVLKLMVDNIIRDMYKRNDFGICDLKKKGFSFKTLTKKQRKEYQAEIADLEPYGA